MSMKSGCCTICLEPLCKDIQVGHCGHVFHRSCIYRWIDSATTCPNCKQHLDASQLTNLFLEPLEIIKEVLNDPMVLQGVDPQLLLKFGTNNFEFDNNDNNDDDLEILNDKKNKHKNNNNKLELIQEKIKNTALIEQNEQLNKKINELTKNIRIIEDEKSNLNRKIQSYLKTAQTYEKKYFDCDEKLSKLTIDLFKKNKELVTAKKDIDKLIRERSIVEHCENIILGNISELNLIEMNKKNDKECDKEYWYIMYLWIKDEYQKNKLDREREKKSQLIQQKKWSEIHEEQRIKIQSLSQSGIKNIDKITKYKKHYFSLKDKYLKLRDKFKFLQEKYNILKVEKEKENDDINDDINDNINDDINSISYDDDQENNII
eukprot:322002_1